MLDGVHAGSCALTQRRLSLISPRCAVGNVPFFILEQR